MEYTKKQISDLTGLPARSVQYFTERGVVIPAVESTGTGKFRIYSERNLCQFALIKQLSDFGMTIDVIRRTSRVVFLKLKSGGKPYDLRWLEEKKPYVIIYNEYDAAGSQGEGRFFPGVIIVPNPDGSKQPDIFAGMDLKWSKSFMVLDLYALFKGLLNQG